MTKNQKIALATLPTLALIVLGTNVASAHIRPSNVLSEEQRSALSSARELRKEGNEEEASKVLEDAGLKNGDIRRFGKGHGHRFGGVLGTKGFRDEDMHTQHKAMQDALESNDIEAFKTAAAGLPFESVITDEVFAKLVEAHQLRESGDVAGARNILKDLALPGRGHEMGNRMGNR